MSRLQEKYKSEVVPGMVEKFGYANVNAVPRFDKITVSMGVGKAIENNKRIDQAVRHLATIAGQKPVVTRAKRSVAGFKLREGMSVGTKVTLRGARMFEFLDRLISIAIPRIRDFRGFSSRAFDGRGNYSLGLTEQVVFPEISVDDVEFVQGMNVTMTFDRSTDEESRALLEMFGFPFRR
ncbi:MAG: 50S ribosomal protein L5 [Planctomycetota bacterium]